MRTVETSDREFQAPAFGRKGACSAMATTGSSTLVDDLKLFALTFAGGFLFVTVYLA